MKQIFNIADLKVGRQYLMVSKQFEGAKNYVTMISGDTLELGRDIAYFIFTERTSVIPSAEGFKKSMQNNKMVSHTFALWGHSFDKESLTQIFELDPKDYKSVSTYGTEGSPQLEDEEVADPNQASLF